jgi:hypothetical protein
MSAEADTTVHAHLVVILNECLLSAAESGDIPRLQVLRCVLGPIRTLTDPGSHSEVAGLGCRSCCDLAPTSRIETGAFGPAGAQGSLLRRTFCGVQSAPRTVSTGQRALAFPCGAAQFAQTTRTGQDCQ